MRAARGIRAKAVSFSAGADMAVLIFFVLIPGTIAGIAASLPILAVFAATWALAIAAALTAAAWLIKT